MAYTVLSISPAREEVMDFSFPFHMQARAVMYKHHASSAEQQFLFIRPYKWQFWICMCLFIPSVGILIWCFNHIFKYIHKKDKEDLKVPLISFTVWSVLGIAFNQGMLCVIDSLALRTLQIV